MASYAGYVRREGKDQVDFAGEMGKASMKIGAAHLVEQTRRKGLSKLGSEGMQQLENIEQHADKGVNDWLQGSVTELKTQIYDEFQLLKKGKINDNEYRQRMSNLSDSWKKFSLVAQNWNKDTEEVLTGVNNGTLSKLSAALLGNKNNITDFNSSRLLMDESGNLVLHNYVTEENKDKYPKLKVGDQIPGSQQQLAGLVDPQNVLSDKWDVSEQLGSVTENIQAYETVIDENGQWITDDPTKRTGWLGIVSDGMEVTTSNDRTLANSMTAMNSLHEYHNKGDDAAYEENIKAYTESGSVQAKKKARVDELKLKYKKENKYRTDAVVEWLAETQAEKEVQGQAALLQIPLAPTGQGNVTEPQFADNVIKADRDMVINYRTYDKATGEFTDETLNVKKGDEVKMGDIQKMNQEANLAQGITDYAGRNLKGNSQTVTEKDKWRVKQDKIKADAKAKADADKKKANTPNYYGTSMRLAGSKPGEKNDAALKDLVASDDNIVDADVDMVDGKQVLKITKKKKDGTTETVPIEYVYDKDGTINREKTARKINKSLLDKDQSEADKAFDDAKEVHGEYADDEEDAYSEIKREQNYVDLDEGSSSTTYNIPERDGDGNIVTDEDGETVMRSEPISQGAIITDITVDKGDKSHVLTSNYLQDLGNIPKDAFVVTEDGSTQTIKVLKKGGDAAVDGDWKEYTFTMDYYDDDENLAQHNQRTKMALMAATKYYHHGDAGDTTDFTEKPEEVDDLDPDKE